MNWSLFGRGRYSLAQAIALIVVVSTATAQDSDEKLQALIQTGEFPAAIEMASAMQGADADRWLGRISRQQFTKGAAGPAFDTAGMIRDDQLRAGALADLYSSTTYDGFRPGGWEIAPQRNAPAGQPGGVTLQDFQPLIDLIKSTIAPDDWDDTNGDGTIQAYPAGVYVDPTGTLRKIKPFQNSRLDSLRQTSIVQSGNRNSSKDSPLRKVSITRLEKTAQEMAARGLELPDEIQNLAGLYEIKYLMVYPETGDIVIAGPAGDWEEDQDGRPLNRKTGRPVLQLDDLVVCLRNAQSNEARFGCTITPRPKNLTATKAFLEASQLRGKAWRDELRNVLGQQDVHVFGIAPETHAARVIVEADYRMKLVAMGLDPSIPEVPSYLARKTAAAGNTPMDIMRLWFTLNYADVTSNSSREVFAFTGPGVKVLSESELLDDQGKRIHTGRSDPLVSAFARDFTEHFSEMADLYPVYRQLKNVFDLALVSAIVHDQGISGQLEWDLTYFGDREEYPLVHRPRLSPAATQVDSVMNHRTLSERRDGKTLKHTIVGVSGGVAFDAYAVAAANLIKTEREGQLDANFERARPRGLHWWWD